MTNDIFNSLTKHISEAQNATILAYLYAYLPDIDKQVSRHISLGERIEKVMNHSTYLVSITSASGYFICVNKQWTKEFGWSFDEFISAPYFTFIHPDDITKSLNASIDVSMFSSDIHLYNTFSNRYRTKQGDYKVVDWFIFNEYRPEQKIFTSIAQLNPKYHA